MHWLVQQLSAVSNISLSRAFSMNRGCLHFKHRPDAEQECSCPQTQRWLEMRALCPPSQQAARGHSAFQRGFSAVTQRVKGRQPSAVRAKRGPPSSASWSSSDQDPSTSISFDIFHAGNGAALSVTTAWFWPVPLAPTGLPQLWLMCLPPVALGHSYWYSCFCLGRQRNSVLRTV